jgi:hypothetical protein
MPQPIAFPSDQRPEQRQRSGGAGLVDDAPGWTETEPACFRSEAFAEDLPAAGSGLPTTGPLSDDDQRRTWRDGLTFMGLALALLYGGRGG